MNEELKKIIENWSDKTVLLILRKIRDEKAVKTGRLYRSIMYEMDDDSVQFFMIEYGKYVDEGTRGRGPRSTPRLRSRLGANSGIRPRRFFREVIEKQLLDLVPQLEEGFVRYLEGRIKILNENTNT